MNTKIVVCIIFLVLYSVKGNGDKERDTEWQQTEKGVRKEEEQSSPMGLEHEQLTTQYPEVVEDSQRPNTEGNGDSQRTNTDEDNDDQMQYQVQGGQNPGEQEQSRRQFPMEQRHSGRQFPREEDFEKQQPEGEKYLEAQDLAKGTLLPNEPEEQKPANISIIVIGRSGSGVSTTVKRLLGARKPTPNVNGSYKGVVVEVSEVPLSTGGFFKIVDVEGVLEGKTIDHDAQVLSTLKSYLQDPEQGNSTNFFIAISKFDDARLYGLKSMFVQTLRRVQMLQEEVYGNTTNTALLLTRLMSETRTIQRKPEGRIAEFRSAIRDFTSFDINSTEIIVGENLPEEYNLKVENGQTRLPNKQYYPQNVFDSLIKTASNLNDSKSVEALEEFMEGRNRPEEIIKRPYPLTKPFIPYLDNSLFMKLHLAASEIHPTELSSQLSNAFSIFNSTIKPQAIQSLITLVQYFKKNNLITLEDLSNKTVDTELFFQSVPSDPFQLALLSEAFNLTKPIVPGSRNGLIEYSEPEINLIEGLSNVFNALNDTTDTDRDSFFKLRDYFQSSNLTTSYNLPMTTLDKVKFFQSVLLDEFQLNLLSTAFKLTMPEFVEQLYVGYGFDVTQDESLVTTPFVQKNLKASSIGYLLPDFINCSIIKPPEKVDIAYYNENFAEYAPTRLRLLGFERDKIPVKFEGKVRMGFTLKPSESDTLLSLSTVREVRAIKCELVYNETDLNEDFKSVLNTLGVFEESDRDSVTEWVAFFEKYGTHIVSLGFGGGRIGGSFGGEGLKEMFKSKQQVEDTLRKIVSFKGLESQEVPIYRFFGGARDKQLEGISGVEHSLREDILGKWENSLRYDPIMLEYQLGLTPISKFAKLVNMTVGEEVERCTQLLLSGKLIYKRKTKPPKPPKSITTPKTTSRTASETPIYQFRTERTEVTISPSATTTTKERPFTTGNEPHEFRKASCPSKPEDYTENTVGQGFNLFNGTVLPTSPFDLGNFVYQSMRNLVPDYSYFYEKGNSWDTLGQQFEKCFHRTFLNMKSGVKVVKLNDIFKKALVETFNSTQEYVLDRIKKSGYVYGIDVIPKGFTDEIPRWVSIQDSISLRENIYLHATTFSKLEIKSTTPLSTEFLQYVRYLPAFSNSDCSVKRAWKKFFETYGTHYVMSAYVGQFDYGEVKSCLKKSPTRDKSSKTIGGIHYNCEEGLIVLKPSLALEKIGIALSDYPYTYKKDVDEAYYWLLRNNLQC